MAKPYGDDLRQKFLSAYDQGDISLQKLAALFHVSLGWAKKVSAARNRGGQAERVPYRPGRKPRAGAQAQQQVKAWFVQQPDLTLAEVQAKLLSQAGVSLSLPPYSPDMNPIEKAWSKLKKFLRDAKARTREALEKAIAEAIRLITADNAKAWFKHRIGGLQ
jgi:transposase